MTHYHTIDRIGQTEYKDRGSRFLAIAFPMETVEDFKIKLDEIKKDHPKAVHHCFAYRLGIDGNNYRANDDGEPSGSAGKPILGQIDSKGLTNIGVVVIRYFGGTLLGVPGLINAYKTSTVLALQMVPMIQKAILVKYQLEFDYLSMHEVMRIIKKNDGVVLASDNQLFSVLKLGIPKEKEMIFCSQILEIRDILVQKI